MLRGAILARSKSFKKAIEDLTQAITLRENYTQAYRERAKVYKASGDQDKQLADTISALVSHGREHHNQGNFEEAKVRFDKALELKPDSPETHQAMAATYYEEGHLLECISHASRALDNDKSRVLLALLIRANAYNELEKFEDAYQDVYEYITTILKRQDRPAMGAIPLHVGLGIQLGKPYAQMRSTHMMILGYLDATRGQNTPVRHELQLLHNQLEAYQRGVKVDTSAALVPDNMPQVELNIPRKNLEKVFKDAWKATQKNRQGQRFISVITPGRLVMGIQGAAPGAYPESQLAPARELIHPPNKKPLNIVVIGNNNVAPMLKQYPNPVLALDKLIPFFGYALAWHYMGNRVIVFEGHESALEIACKKADALMIDKAMLPYLPQNWTARIEKVMRRVYVGIIGRQDGDVQVFMK